MKPETTALRPQRAEPTRSRRTSTSDMSGGARRRTWIMVAVFAFSSIGTSACFLDFDEFEASDSTVLDGGTDPDKDADGDAKDDQDGAGPGEGDAWQPQGPDGGDPSSSAAIGGTCADDADCEGAGLCRQNYCTADCSGGGTCQAGSSCQQITRGPNAGEALCVIDCNHGDDAACGQIAGRDDLRCLPVNQLPDDSFGPNAQSACLPDQDGDQVADLLDNCIDTANPDQLDFDADGIGNACDSEPNCHELAVDGVLDYGTIDYPASNFSFPDSTHHDWVPVFGGTDADGDQIATLRILDRASGTWKSVSDLPFAAFDRHVTPSQNGEYGMTPGAAEPGGEPFNQPLFLTRNGEARLAPKAIFSAGVTSAASTAQNQIFVHEYTNVSSTTVPLDWATNRLDLERPLSNQTVSTGASKNISWYSTQLLSGGVLFYSDIAAQDTTMFLNFSDPLGQSFSKRTLVPPTDGGTQISPFVIPAGGQYIYIMDRNSGIMARYSTATDSITSTPELNVDLSDMENPEFISTPQSLSFIALDRPTDSPNELRAREFFLGCMPEYESADTDGDGVNDFLDNCPVFSNYDQSDIDGDRVGDSCDPDTDGDGYSDAAEIDAGADPLDPFSFPEAGYLTYIRDDGTTRTLEYAALSELDAPTVLTASGAAEPHQPRFIGTKSKIMTLSGAPESATAVDIFDIHGSDATAPSTLDTGVTLRSAAILDASYSDATPPVITAIHPNAARPGTWALSDISTADQSATRLDVAFPELRHLSSNGKGYATFLGGPSDCDACLSGYLLGSDDISTIAWSGERDGWLNTSINRNNKIAAIFPAEDGWGSAGYFQGDYFRPPGSTQINSFLSTGSGNNLIASARRNDASPYELWFYNASTQKWHLLLSAAEDLIEVDWVVDIPENSGTLEPEFPAETDP